MGKSDFTRIQWSEPVTISTIAFTESGEVSDAAAPPHQLISAAVMMRVGEILELGLKLTLWLYIPILVLGVVGNSLSFHMLLKRAKTSSTYTYLATLSVMDSIFLIVSIGTWTVFAASSGAIDLRIILDCNFILACQHIPKEISAWFLVIISLERCLVVYLPTKAKSICHHGRSKIIIFLTILVACLVNWNTFGSYRTNKKPVYLGDLVCPARNLGLQYYNTVVYGWINSVLYSYLPSLAIILLNGAIVFKFLSASRANTVGVASGEATEARNRTMAKNSTRMTVTGIVLCSTYLVLTLPQAIHDLYFRAHVHTRETDPIFYYTQWFILQMLSALFHLNHAINLALYCLTNSGIRRDLRRILLCKSDVVQVHSNPVSGSRPGPVRSNLVRITQDTNI